jgi:xylulokinase
VVCPAEEEAAAFGAALQALWMLQGGEDLCGLIKKHVSLDRRKAHRPRASQVSAYKAAYEHYKRYVETVMPIFA